MSVHALDCGRDALHANGLLNGYVNGHASARVSGRADEHGADRGCACVAVVIDAEAGAVMMDRGNDNDGGEHRLMMIVVVHNNRLWVFLVSSCV
ncbi:hypothetical protein [Photobacterium sanguinicancri]|uniref:hypothetical protein n=1 Tax=Photobacterium sanguinicancri TaxID=875932 RepID=UPI000786F710|nr:hypothetical protein [Photobacterium sanguinicancri]KXI24579.1 hypothetical protein AS132_01080 [Photobacterium sanguinicancri]